MKKFFILAIIVSTSTFAAKQRQEHNLSNFVLDTQSYEHAVTTLNLLSSVTYDNPLEGWCLNGSSKHNNPYTKLQKNVVPNATKFLKQYFESLSVSQDPATLTPENARLAQDFLSKIDYFITFKRLTALRLASGEEPREIKKSTPFLMRVVAHKKKSTWHQANDKCCRVARVYPIPNDNERIHQGTINLCRDTIEQAQAFITKYYEHISNFANEEEEKKEAK